MGLTSQQIINTIRSLVESHQEADFSIDDLEKILRILLEGEMELEGLMPWSSNYTFLTNVKDPAGQSKLLAIYKPGQGERPLWDFPEGTLSHREVATYLVSSALGWPKIPPTVLRDDAPHGQGSVQLFIKADYEAHYFNMRHLPGFIETFRQIALFDYIVNNADRKGGHCLKGEDGQIWAIDHGLTFHTDHKLRTVIWEFCSDPIPEALLKDLERLRDLVQESSELCQVLRQLISPVEVQTCLNRINVLLNRGYFPELRAGRNVPFPPV